MKIFIQLFRPLLALALLLLQTSLTWSAQQVKATAPVLQFAAGQSANEIPFDFVSNHIYLRARINESEPLWFLFDTGATASYFDAQRAQALGLGGQGDSIKGASLTLPGLKLLNQNFSIQPLRFSAYDGHAVDGLLGYDFISRFVVEIDYAKRLINLHEPESYRYQGAGDILPLVMLEDDSGGKVPLVRAKIAQRGRAPLEGKFIADTGVRSAISFNTPFVEMNKLLQFAPQTIRAPLGGGAMVRESQQAIGRLQNVGLGRFTFKNPVAIFFQDRQGVIASPEFDGIIGGEILRRFKTIYDYSRRRMILESNHHYSEREEYDMSGLLLIAEGADFRTFRVKRVMENSPATAAGLREGDVIAALEGQPASNFTLEEVRQMFKRKGLSYRLAVERGAEKMELKLKLRRLI